MSFIRELASNVLRTLQKNRLYRQTIRQHFQAVKIREAGDADILAVYQWINPKIELDQPIKQSPNVHEWVAEHRGRIVGFVQLVFHPFENTSFGGYWLFSLMVRTYMRGMGIGESLVRVVIDKAKEEGAPFLRLIVSEDNNAAVHLYQKLGFVKKSIPELESVLKEEFNRTKRMRIVMEKILSDQNS